VITRVKNKTGLCVSLFVKKKDAELSKRRKWWTARSCERERGGEEKIWEQDTEQRDESDRLGGVVEAKAEETNEGW
jgi:hypothetical protein